MPEIHSVKRHHHEWPQEKGDLDHSNFHPQERPAEEGAFLVRDCSKCTPQEPLVLAVFYKHRVYNIQIRYSECSSKYTLGTGLRTNDAFDNVADIIKFHSIFPIALIDGRNPNEDQRRTCVLLYPVTRTDILQLLRKDT
ncbi:cytokine-dependent hematopoietic cell linker-like isoform X2 [Alosa pseudoharengus]|uniref:cytokine-dependent hematopoietic cell linker-like isoform X2 n=1 Tax=Alosa pseudoharengus TaxID=34774 RepID=UPI003F8C6D38